MDNRPLLVRAACVASGVALIVLGSLIVPASGIASLFLFDESASGNPYVDDDATLGAFVLACVIALAYGVFAAPALWKRRPLQAKEPQPAPMAAWWQNPAFPYDAGAWDRGYDGTPGHFWEHRHVAVAPSMMPITESAVPFVPDPVIEVGRPVDLDEIEAIERVRGTESGQSFVEESVPTVIGLPAAIAVKPDDEVCNDDDWFT